MMWEDTEETLTNDTNRLGYIESSHFTKSICAENENKEKAFIQLQKYCNEELNMKRRALNDIADRFLEHMSKNQLQEIDLTLLSGDCFLYIIDSFKESTLTFSRKLGEGFIQLYKNIKINGIEVLETSIDAEKSTVCRLSKYLIWYADENKEGDGDLAEKICFELFSIKDHKIWKYRASFAAILPSHGPEPLAPTIKDSMLTRIKELNFALAGNPNFTKVAEMLDEKTEYKIYSWDDQKCFTANKQNMVEIFNELQDKLKITKIVPYDLSAQPSKVVASYTYYLEDKTNTEMKFIWINNCVYLFDGDRIDRITQLGELYPEDEAVIPFQVHSRESMEAIIREQYRYKGNKVSFDEFFEHDVDFKCVKYNFGTDNPSNGVEYGLGNGDLDKLKKLFEFIAIRQVDVVDIYLDQQDPSYAIGFACLNVKLKIIKEGHKDYNKEGSCISFVKLCFANNKLCKSVSFYPTIFGIFPSCFDDNEYSTEYIVPLKEFYRQD